MSSDTNEQLVDTPRPNPEVVSDANAAILRQMTSLQRMECGFRLRDRVLEMIANAVRKRHPEWTEQQVRREAGRKITHEEFEDIPRSMLYFNGERDLPTN